MARKRERVWQLRLACDACGQSFASMTEEARHRHNFPLLCREAAPKRATLSRGEGAPLPLPSPREGARL
jgi:hypothetical protein